MREWKAYKLGDLTQLVTKGTTPSTLGGRFLDKGINFIKSEAVGYNGRIDKSTFVFIDEATHQKLKRSQLAKDDILFSMAGIFLGKNALVPEDVLPANTNQALAIIRLNQDKANPKFIHYYLRQRSVIEFVNNMSGQSAQPNINFEEIRSIDILLPELEEQFQISSILSSLDDKIDLLHRQNKTLEALAETLFRQRFVEDAESLGNKTLDELIVFDPREKVSSNIEYIFFDMKCLSNSSMAIADGIKRTVNSGSSFRNGDSLLAKITPCLENGKTGFVMNLKEDELARGSTEFIVMRAKEDTSPYFVYCLARYSDFRNTAILSMTGTSGRQRVQTAVLKNYEISYSKGLMEEFHSTCHPHFLKIRQNQNQIRTLTRLRDTLLPKLMSGEVRVND